MNRCILSTHVTCAHKKINMFTVQSIRSPSHDYSSNVPLYFPSHTSVANVFSQEYLSTHAFTSITYSTAHNAHCSSCIRCFQTLSIIFNDNFIFLFFAIIHLDFSQTVHFSPHQQKISSFPSPFFSPCDIAHRIILWMLLSYYSYRKWTMPQTCVVRRILFWRLFSLQPSLRPLFLAAF